MSHLGVGLLLKYSAVLVHFTGKVNPVKKTKIEMQKSIILQIREIKINIENFRGLKSQEIFVQLPNTIGAPIVRV